MPPSDPYVVPRGLGIEFQIHVPPHELSGCFCCTAQPVGVSEMRERRPGERGFRAEIIGYRFPILGAIRILIWRWSPPIQGSLRLRMVCASVTARTA